MQKLQLVNHFHLFPFQHPLDQILPPPGLDITVMTVDVFENQPGGNWAEDILTVCQMGYFYVTSGCFVQFTHWLGVGMGFRNTWVPDSLCLLSRCGASSHVVVRLCLQHSPPEICGECRASLKCTEPKMVCWKILPVIRCVQLKNRGQNPWLPVKIKALRVDI